MQYYIDHMIHDLRAAMLTYSFMATISMG